MRITTRFPAVARGRVKRMASDRLVFCLPEIDFDIPEYSSDDVPLALRTQWDDRTLDYRMLDGKLYRPMRETVQISDLSAPPTTLISRLNHPIFHRMATAVAARVGNEREANETRPERFYQRFSSLDQADIDRAVADAENMVDDEVTKADLLEWENQARSRLAQILILDGALWETAPEPCYQLMAHNGSIGLSDVSFYEAGLSHRHPLRYDYQNLDYRYFGAGDFAAALEFSEKMKPIGSTPETGPRIDVFMPEALTTDFVELELDRAARVSVSKFEQHLNSTARKGAGYLLDVPREALLSACLLRDAIATREAGDPVAESLVTRLEAFAHVLGRNPELCEQMRFEDMPNILDIVETWTNTEVTLSLDVPAGMRMR